MKILHTVAGLFRGTGGPAASVPRLCTELAGRGHEVTLLTGAGALADTLTPPLPFRLVTMALGPYALANTSRRFWTVARKQAATHDVVHDHGLWLFTNWASGRAAQAARCPWIRSPRGMLEPWALARGRWRKQVLWRLFEASATARAARVHATSKTEARSVAAVCPNARVEVIPNGIDLTEEFALAGWAGVTVERGELRFLSRIHPKKGLDLLLDAWQRRATQDSRLVIGGGGEGEHVAALREQLAALKDPTITYVGTVPHADRVRWLASAHAVVLPTYSENYGMVVAEALACATPVITTTGTPWSSIETDACGWYVAPEVGALTRAIDEALALTPERRAEMGQRGRALIEREHSASAAAARMEQLYETVLREKTTGA